MVQYFGMYHHFWSWCIASFKSYLKGHLPWYRISQGRVHILFYFLLCFFNSNWGITMQLLPGNWYSLREWSLGLVPLSTSKVDCSCAQLLRIFFAAEKQTSMNAMKLLMALKSECQIFRWKEPQSAIIVQGMHYIHLACASLDEWCTRWLRKLRSRVRSPDKLIFGPPPFLVFMVLTILILVGTCNNSGIFWDIGRCS